LAKKKKQALNDLLVKKRMSQPTYEYLVRSFTDNILELEAHQRSLADKMGRRANELERQMDLLGSFLANLEIHHVGEETDDETYTRHKKVFMSGSDATRIELSQIRNSLSKMIPDSAEAAEARMT
jgi:hypothetical protein